MFLFAYGSLIWKPDFDYISKTPAYIKNFVIRFWQKSYEHGRVATIIEAPGGAALGILYEIDDEIGDAIINNLDEREKNYSKNVLYVHTGKNEITPAYVFIGNDAEKEDIDTSAKAIVMSGGDEYLADLYSCNNSDAYLEKLFGIVKYHEYENQKKYELLVLIILIIVVFALIIYNVRNSNNYET